jgi:hypothetical protein
MSIRAEVHDDNHIFEVEFDATPYFAQASLEEIVELAQTDWAYDYPADAVALFFEDGPHKIDEIEDLMEYTRRTQGRRGAIGFGCSVTSEDVYAWLEAEHPDWVEAVKKAER